jgi:hypothetical protein
MDQEISRRLGEPADALTLWRSVPAALEELRDLMEEELTADERKRMLALEVHLLGRLSARSESTNLNKPSQ